MGKTERLLLLFALMLLGGGWSLYDLGSRLNLEVGDSDRMLWEQAPGDKWLYVGGLMMLISGALAVAAFRFWRGKQKRGGKFVVGWARKSLIDLYGRPTVGAPHCPVTSSGDSVR